MLVVLLSRLQSASLCLQMLKEEDMDRQHTLRSAITLKASEGQKESDGTYKKTERPKGPECVTWLQSLLDWMSFCAGVFGDC